MSERRAKRDRKRRDGKQHRRIPIGGGMEQAAPDEVLRAIGRLPKDLDWETMAANVFPVMPRRRPLPPEIGEPLRVLLPPGVMTGFGIDIGPAVLHVGPDMVERWGLGPAEVAARALENLRNRTARTEPRDLLAETLDGVAVRILQSGWGWASTLVLLPDEAIRILGDRDQCLIAPMRDLLISFPFETDRELIGWINEEFSQMDPNGLALEAFTLRDGTLAYEPLGRSLLRA